MAFKTKNKALSNGPSPEEIDCVKSDADTESETETVVTEPQIVFEGEGHFFTKLLFSRTHFL